MTWSRREVLATLGVASANAVLFACGGAPRRALHAAEMSPEVHAWLREALAILVAAGLDRPHVLAVASRRTTAALDVIGSGVARARTEGVVLAARDTTGTAREQMTNDLSRDGVLAATRALLGLERTAKLRAASIDVGAAPPPVERVMPDPDSLSDSDLLARVNAIAARDKGRSSRIVYAANVLDIDDAHVWSVAPGRSLEQRLVRVRRSVSRVAWHGTRPFVGEAARAWTGGIDAQDLTDDEITGASDNALTLLTPTPFDDKEYAVLLDPAIGVALFDAVVRIALPMSERLTIVHDPTVRDAYGTIRFDDTGGAATASTLVEAGRPVGRLERTQRAGHLGRLQTALSHVRIAPGTISAAALLDGGMLLEGHQSTLVDAASDRVVIQVARAREYIAGRATGRAFGDIEIAGPLSTLLRAVSGVSRESRAIGVRDDVDGLPVHRSYDIPWLAVTAHLRQRRRTA